jgi:1,6-anhydro-N-acetylmuramate kinase
VSDTCYCDGERPDVYHAHTMRARARYKCYECGGCIAAGEQYERAAMLYEGSWEVARTCRLCLDAREYIMAHAPCFCWLHGSMLDDAKEVLIEHGHASAGFYLGGMKRVLRAERHQPTTRSQP